MSAICPKKVSIFRPTLSEGSPVDRELFECPNECDGPLLAEREPIEVRIAPKLGAALTALAEKYLGEDEYICPQDAAGRTILVEVRPDTEIYYLEEENLD